MSKCSGLCNQGRMCDCSDKEWLKEVNFWDELGLTAIGVVMLIGLLAWWVMV